jgi:dTDP-4-dehydrorhamnose 3,5-epimerase
MKFTKTKFEDVILIQPDIFKDDRGYFCESFRHDEFCREVDNINFVLEFESRSKKNTLRGLHYQSNPKAQSKLVSVSYGKVLDIIVDVRKDSNTFGQYITVELSNENNTQVYIPKGYAHGFLALSEEAVMHYKLDDYYSPENYTGINIFDEKLNIQLPINKDKLCISPKDLELPILDKAILF